MSTWLIMVLLGIIVILYASMLPSKKIKQPVQDDFLFAVGDTLQQFADEIEEENKELLRMVGDMKREHEVKSRTLMERIEQLEKRSLARSVETPTAAGEPVLSAEASAAAPEPELEPILERAKPSFDAAGESRFATTVKSRYKELFELYDSGKSIEHIARKLGKNKGEVQLIIGLARQEEPHHGQP